MDRNVASFIAAVLFASAAAPTLAAEPTAAPPPQKYDAQYARDRAEIEDLQARYLFALDWQDADAYAATFSAFYTPLMALILALIFRAVAIEFRSRHSAPAWRRTWDFAFFLASAVSPVIFGARIDASTTHDVFRSSSSFLPSSVRYSWMASRNSG